MKISVIIPSFNQGAFIGETLESIVGQDHSDLELIVIDGGSTDHTPDVIRLFEDRIDHWVSEPDNGQAHAINKGLARATGEIVCWLNSDDVYRPGALKAVEDFFRRHTEIDALQGAVQNFGPQIPDRIIPARNIKLTDIVRRVPFHQPGVFWRRRVTDVVGLLDETLHYCMDYDLFMRIFLKFRFGYTDKVLAGFRVHDSAKTGRNPIDMYLEYRKVVSRFFASVSEQAVSVLERAGVYDNPENIRYPVSTKLTGSGIRRLTEIYLYECAVQEYTRGRGLTAVKLAWLGWNGTVFPKNLVLLIKSMTGFGVLMHRLR